ncbi:threonine aldolase family protein [Umezawaea endophytica]|uniref:Beta-eliminating lyase-related protein n=1 Tax=Umezawaea endophytica TaxID=1654476 RepID=A0A9X2VJ41_9PSEU|nr:beta-eliminating lyase-related protein [Umezawaea endophytica]MCS7477319.1 beta-eliminating lyase-related protein [Umezawaea endophytica]
MSDVEKRIQIRRSCARSLSGHGEPTMRERLAGLIALPESEGYPDLYGFGDPVTLLEHRVAELLGKPAARFVVKGVIAQQAALRTWTDSVRIGTVALHPLSHVDSDELGAFERLHPLRGVRLGGKRGFGVEELEKVGEPLGAVTVELPLRNAGFALPEWDDLVAVSRWCREHGVPLHFDGARLWESAPYYGRGLDELADLADSVYVSFYKGLGGLAGCALVGSEDFLARATPWLTRHGANVWANYPYALSAIDGLNRYLPRMSAYRDRAITLAAAIAGVPGVTVGEPQTNGFRVFLPGSPDALRDAHLRLAERTGTWLFPGAAETDVPGLSAVEVVVGEATSAVTDAEAAALFADLLASVEGDG